MIVTSIGSNDSKGIVLGGNGGDNNRPQNNIPPKVSWADIVKAIVINHHHQ
jgi:hypothetical protein